MWLERVHAFAFGPLHEKTLELGPGMNVIVGPNESGKSSWHGAIYASLCGLRRTKGSRKSEEREFIAQHKPWNRSQWRVTATLHTENGRTIELRQDLANLVDCRATDLALGRDVSNEIMNGGSPDASRWLGLDRSSFRATACVRQADVLEVQRSPRILQSALQRAAASVPADATAAEALLRLQEFETEQIGSERAPTRPLRQAQALVERASDELRYARDDHLDYILLAAQADQAGVAADAAATRLRAALAARSAVSAQAMEERLKEVRALASKFEGLERPRLSGPEDELALQVSSALDRFARRPDLPPQAPQSSESIRQALLAADGDLHGDIAMHPSVESAWRSWWESSNALQRHGREETSAMPAPDAGGYTADELTDFAAEIAYAPQSRRVTPAAGQQRIPIIVWVLAGVAALGLILALLGAVLPGVATLVLSLAVAAVLLNRHQPAIVQEFGPRSSPLVEHLEERGLPLNGPALRKLAASVREYEQLNRERRRWQDAHETLVLEDRSRQEDLRRALRERGHPVGDSQLTGDALQSYQQECAARREAVSEAGSLRGELERAELLESRYASVSAELEAIADQLRRLAHATGTPVEPGAEVTFIAAALRGWEVQRRIRLGELDDQQRDWSRLEALLDGHSLEELEVHADLARNISRTARLGIPEADFTDALSAFTSGKGEPHLEAVTDADRAAREELTRQAERLRLRASSVRDVAAAEEAHASATLELERLRELAEVVRLTQQFMTSAADRAHRTIAPVIQSSLSGHISAATHGRYVEALVDPESLDVRVRTAGGYWRPASALSHGTTEQIYLLLRVALAEHLVVAGERSPLILDDVTVHSDAVRTAAVLDTLHSLSDERQIILFSQEDEVADWATSCLHSTRDRLIRLSELPV